MASPTVESRIEPHKKALFSLHVSDRVADHDSSRVRYSSVKYNHKPAQTSQSQSRTTTLACTAPDLYSLRLEDTSSSGDKDVFTFTGHRAPANKSYILLFDPTSQKATLEPLSDSYTFNIAAHNNKNLSAQYPKIYPRKSKEARQDDHGEEDLFGEAVAEDESGEPDANNPYDFRHFLNKEKEKRGDESDYHVASSPDYRTGTGTGAGTGAGTGSATNTPQFGATKPQKKRKTAESSMFMKKKAAAAKKAQPMPTINLERRASERPAADAAPKPKGKAAGPPASKIKSAEIVHSSDESDVDADGETEHVSSPPRQLSPSPQYRPVSDQEDEDAEGESDDSGHLEIEVPDEHPSRPRNGGALKSLGLGQNLGVGGRGLRSPSNGPISLASATNSNQGSPNSNNLTPRRNRAQHDHTVIDFGDLGGVAEDAEGEDDDEDDGDVDMEDADPDVEVMDIGPPARQGTSGHERKLSMAAEEDEEDPLYQEMMAGLAGGDSSEESEEE